MLKIILFDINIAGKGGSGFYAVTPKPSPGKVVLAVWHWLQKQIILDL